VDLQTMRQLVILKASKDGMQLSQVDTPLLNSMLNEAYVKFSHDTGLLKRVVSLSSPNSASAYDAYRANAGTSASYDAYRLPTGYSASASLTAASNAASREATEVEVDNIIRVEYASSMLKQNNMYDIAELTFSSSDNTIWENV